MNRGIAVLLQGTHADLFASLRALELATRTKGKLHAVDFKMADPPGREGLRVDGLRDLQKLLAWFGEIEGVKVDCHQLETDDDSRDLIEFIIKHRIICLVIGAKDEATREWLRGWTALLRQELISQERWYFKTFWIVIAEPWDRRTFDQVLTRLGRYRDLSPAPTEKG